MTHDNELLPCPFCGGIDLKVFDNAVCCMNNKCEAGNDLGHCVGPECRALAIKYWNTRTPPPPSGDAVRSIVIKAMEEAWNDICADTHHHPFDITQHAGRKLEFSPAHWASFTADIVANKLRALPATPVEGYEAIPTSTNPPSEPAPEGFMYATSAELFQELGASIPDCEKQERELNEVIRRTDIKSVNPSSAERMDALDLIATAFDSFYDDEPFYEQEVKRAIETIRAALSAPVTDTGWIDDAVDSGDELSIGRQSGPHKWCAVICDNNMKESRGYGQTVKEAVGNAVKQKLDGRG